MLKDILTSENCKSCKFCCSFRRQSLWETPLFSLLEKNNLEKKFSSSKFKNVFQDIYTINLDSEYKTDSSEEEQICYFLDKDKGCLLSSEEKPFDCKIWPFRVMKKNDDLLIALTPTCPTVNKYSLDFLKSFVEKNIAFEVFDYAKKNPYVIKNYREDFPIMIFEKDFSNENS